MFNCVTNGAFQSGGSKSALYQKIGGAGHFALHEAAKIGLTDIAWPKQYRMAKMQYETNLARAAAQPVVK